MRFGRTVFLLLVVMPALTGLGKVARETEPHWSFQPVVRPELPEVADEAWTRNPIDRFILARLEAAGLKPSSSATQEQLLRRLHLNLTGLPPTLEEQESHDRNPDWETRIDDLLSRTGYGERFARHWLDVVRYADSNGYERDAAKPEVWRYRDYVIRSFNEDKPFDRFILEQLAGDELEDATAATRIATGYNRLGPWDDEPADFAVDRFDQLDDLVNTTSQAFLGLTLGCARCHDHKFEPLLQTDYYSMVATFDVLKRPQAGRKELTRYLASPEKTKELEALDGKIKAARNAVKETTDKLKKAAGNETLAAELEQRKAALAELEKSHPGTLRGYFLYEPGNKPPVTRLLLRGNPKTPGEVAPPAVPAVLVEQQPALLAPSAHTSRRRLSLAEWIASPENPLTARVIVNRVWLWHFGEGLVRTPNDFGLMGERPTHPELLDWLAHWFVHEANGSLKKLHRLILTSRTWRMSRVPDANNPAKDPENRLWSHLPIRRLEVEALRDSMLFVSGKLDPKPFGPPMHPFVPREALLNHADKESIWPKFDERSANRRTIYAFVKRSLLVPMLETLDFCDVTQTSPQRKVTTVPTQALELYNGNFANRQAGHFAERIVREVGEEPAGQIRRAWELALARSPTQTELDKATRFLEKENLKQLCRVIFNLNEFAYPR